MARRPRRPAKRPTRTPARRQSAGSRAESALEALARRLEQEGPKARDARRRRTRAAVLAAAAKIRQRVDDGHELWQEAIGEPMPLELKDITAAAVRFGLSADAALAGNYTLDDVTTVMAGKRLAAADALRDRVRAAEAEAAINRTAAAVPPNTPADSADQSGFLGGEELFVALDIHPSRRDAFDKQLERTRRTLVIDGNCREVREPPPNTPAFLYRVIAVAKLAERYRTPKPA